jgi:hypothetical protein
MLIANSLSFIHPITQQRLNIVADFDEQWHHVFKELCWSFNEL